MPDTAERTVIIGEGTALFIPDETFYALTIFRQMQFGEEKAVIRVERDGCEAVFVAGPYEDGGFAQLVLEELTRDSVRELVVWVRKAEERARATEAKQEARNWEAEGGFQSEAERS